MATVNSTSSVSYTPTLTSYNSDLALLTDSGLTTETTADPAYILDGILSSSEDTTSSSVPQDSQSGVTPAAYSLPSAFTNLNLLDQTTPAELSYLMGLSSSQPTSSSSSSTSTPQAVTPTEADLYPASSPGVNPLGDAISWQIGDATLYQLDPSLLSVLNTAPSSDSSTYGQSQASDNVGATVDASA